MDRTTRERPRSTEPRTCTGRGRWLVPLVAGAVAITACGDGGDGDAATTTTAEVVADDGGDAEPGAGDETAGDEVAALDLGRVVVLGEDFLLADVLALGGEPIAATTTLGDRFSGIEADTGDIEPLDQLSLDGERIAALRPDLLVTTEFYAQEAGRDRLEAIAETVVVPSGDWREQLTVLGDELGAADRAEALLAEYDEAVAAADEEIDDDLTVSMATVYSGDSIAFWVDGPVNIPQTFLDAGVTLEPDPDEVPADAGGTGGRAFVSLELLEELTGDVIVLLQTSSVEGEDQSLATVRESGLWQQLPAVQDDRVVLVDRLGYAGVPGRIRLARELPEVLS